MSKIDFTITPQPDEASCGPACLHAVYAHYGLDLTLEQVMADVRQFPEGGTLAVLLGLDALSRGFDVTIHTCNLHLFDPTWFGPDAPPLAQRLRAQMHAKPDPKLRESSAAYLEYLEAGGRVDMGDVNTDLIRRLHAGDTPVIAGLSATWLYQCARERQSDLRPDDVAGEPTGHFIVIRGVDDTTGRVSIADPYVHDPVPASHYYDVDSDRLIAAILLGIVTYDAKLLVMRPRNGKQAVSSGSRQ